MPFINFKKKINSSRTTKQIGHKLFQPAIKKQETEDRQQISASMISFLDDKLLMFFGVLF